MWLYLAALLFLPSFGRAHVPVPESVLHPATAPEAWNVLRLATDNLDCLLREHRLAEIPDQASLCNPALRALAAEVTDGSERQRNVKADTVRASVTLTTLAQAAIAGDAELAARALNTFRADQRELAASFDPATVQADVFVCPMHPEIVSTDPATPCPRCGMALIRRRIPYSFVYTAPGEPTLRLSVSPASGPLPLVAGRVNRVVLHLAHADGQPVLLSELETIHTQPIHLLIVAPDLGDYHHEHPSSTEVPGDYAFSFTPTENSRYRVFADLVPTATGAQEYPSVDLPGSADLPARIDHAVSDTAKVSGLVFHLTDDHGDPAAPHANQTCSLRITLATADGQPMTRLEPVMAAFAHLVGFYEDGRTVVHLHPAGGEVNDTNQRGGSTLSFQFYPPKTGFLRLYCQVQVDGKQVFAPFGLNVLP